MTTMPNDTKNYWHHMDAQEVANQFQTDPSSGITAEEAASRLVRFGANELREKPGQPAWVRFIHQFKSPLIYVLLAAAIIAAVLGEFKDSFVIMGVLMINAIVGFIQEGRAERSMAALRKLSAPKSHVRRGGKLQSVLSRELVPGDILILSAGDRIAADARLTNVASLVVLEGALTGESTGVNKRLDPQPENAPLADRKSMVYAGTVVAAGRAEAVIVATGMKSELGKIAEMVQEAVQPLTPLQMRLAQLSRIIIFVVLTVTAIVFGIGVWRQLPLEEMLLVSLSMAVSAIPEGLPVAVTVALAVGMQRMAKRRAIIRKLAAVETLGSANVICSDKTGTLTRNEMSVTRLLLADDAELRATGIGYKPEGRFELNGNGAGELPDPTRVRLHLLLEVGALCNDAALLEPFEDLDWRLEGDPTEGALIVAAAKAGINVESLLHDQPRVWEIPFDPISRMMATAHRNGGDNQSLRVCVKGAPEAVLGLCGTIQLATGKSALTDEQRQRIAEAQRDMASDGLRVLAFAQAYLLSGELDSSYERLRGKMTFVGLMGEIDPPRPEVRDAVALCKQAGIRTVMVTGDHLLTGASIARELGIADADSLALEGSAVHTMDDRAFEDALQRVAVFGRVAPEHKLRIVEGFQKQKKVVAMTGDGVNDAPALAKADIGVAMGITGTEVAKEASAMVITDDNFASIVDAVEQGRIIFQNIRKTIFYLFSTSAAEILTLTTALIAGLPLPLRAVQILWINLVTDGALTVNLIMEKAEGNEMRRAPEPRTASILPAAFLWRMLALVPIMGMGTVLLFVWALSTDREYEKAQTMAFSALCAFQWFNGLNARSASKSIFEIGLLSNKFVMVGLTIAITLQVLVVQLPIFGTLFHTVPLTLQEWVIVVGVASTVLWADEAGKLARRLLRRN
jgi:magnesium-transporting ATPase (P-type)